MIICSCKNITQQQVDDAIKSGKCTSPGELARRLGLGTDCGSCLQEVLNAPTNFSSNQNSSVSPNIKKIST